MKDIDQTPVLYGSGPRELAVVGDYAYFSSFDVSHGTELWKTDGVPGRAELVKDITPGEASTNLYAFVATEDKLFFWVNHQANPALWTSSGSAESTTLVKHLTPYVTSGPFPSMIAAGLGGQLLFVADNEQTGPELWRSDGTSEGTTLIKELRPGNQGAFDQLDDSRGRCSLFHGG